MTVPTPPSLTTSAVQSEITLAVVVSRLDDLRDNVRTLTALVSNQPQHMVTRPEWEMRNKAVDQRFEGQGREIAELKAARAPWWSTWSVVLSGAALAWVILGPTITGR